MKLYTLYNTKEKKIVAISEEKQYILRYIIQNNYSKIYKLSKLTDINIINKYLIMYDDLYLDVIENIVLTTAERRIVNSDIKECKSKVKDCILDLTDMIRDFSFSDKDKDIILKSIKILSSNIKPKKMGTFFNIKESIVNLFISKRENISDLFEEHNTLRDKYMIDINMDE